MVKAIKVAMAIGLGLLVSGVTLADGFYLGGQLGLDRCNNKKDIEAFPTEFKKTKSALNGGVYGGYKMDVSESMRVAFEADLFLFTKKYTTMDSFPSDEAVPTYRHKSLTFYDKIEYMGNLSVLGSYVIDEAFEIYGRLGLSITSVKLDKIAMYETSLAGVVTVENVEHLEKRDRPIGLVVGVGLNTNLGKFNSALENVDLRADYRYIHYQSKNIYFSSDEDDGFVKYKLSRHLFMIGLDYKF